MGSRDIAFHRSAYGFYISQLLSLMRLFSATYILLALAGCAVGANLTPIKPGSDRYWMFYDRSTVQAHIAKNISPDARMKIYEDRVNLILESDPITAECRVEKGSVNFGEPGSSGAAIVRCLGALPMVNDGMSYVDGSPSYRYRLKSNSDNLHSPQQLQPVAAPVRPQIGE